MEKIGTQAYKINCLTLGGSIPYFMYRYLNNGEKAVEQQVLGEVELEDVDRPEYFEAEKILRWS